MSEKTHYKVRDWEEKQRYAVIGRAAKCHWWRWYIAIVEGHCADTLPDGVLEDSEEDRLHDMGWGRLGGMGVCVRRWNRTIFRYMLDRDSEENRYHEFGRNAYSRVHDCIFGLAARVNPLG